METIAMRIADENIPRIADVDPVGEVRNIVRSNTSQVTTVFVKHDHAVALEVAYKVFLACNKPNIVLDFATSHVAFKL